MCRGAKCVSIDVGLSMTIPVTSQYKFFANFLARSLARLSKVLEKFNKVLTE